MTLHLTSAFQVIISCLIRKKLQIIFFLQFLHIAEISQRANSSRTFIPPVPCISQILTTFNLYSGKPNILRGGGQPPPQIHPIGQIC